MEDALAQETLTGKASIIIVSYNGWHATTLPCLESIFALTDYPDYEVIVVDNNSSDGTPEYLTEFAAREPRLRCILNRTNRGFAGGNNDALAVATGRYLILLNSDTQVAPGWLTQLVRPLEEDSGIGLVGPVSNATGNEQEIFTCGTDAEAILREGALWTSAGSAERVPMERLCFFCVATRADVVEQVGVLDERYGLGFYEDDDYCLRVARTGYRLVLNEAVFVYHRGSASFSSCPDSVKKLMRHNRGLLEAKFGIGRYRTAHPRQRQLELVGRYLERLPQDSSGALQYKIANRLKQLGRLRPRGFFKRFFFDRQVRRLEETFRRCTQ